MKASAPLSDKPARDSLARPIVLLSLAAGVSAATLRVADPLLPQLAEEFQSSVADASIVATGFTLAYGLCQLFYGPLGDRFGKYALIALTTLLSALGTGGAALVDDLQSLAVLRFLSGCTAGAIIPLSLAHIGDVVPFDSRQAVLARFLSGQVMGVIAGQALGGIIGDLVGWRGAFALLGILYFVAGFMLLGQVRAQRSATVPRPLSLAGLASSYIALGRSAKSRAILASVFVEGLLFYGTFTYIGAFLRDHAGLSYGIIGLILACFGLGALAYTTAAPRIVPRLGRSGLVTGGGAALALGFGLLALAPPWWVAPALVAIVGLGFYMMHNTLQTLATQMAPEARGLAVSLFASCLFLGQAAGIALGGLTVASLGYSWLFLGACAGLLGLAAYLRGWVASAGG